MSYFDSTIIQKVWEKGGITSDPMNWRKDQCNAWIFRSAYGDRDSSYGWEIDHIKHVSDGGSDDISNLRPLHWKNNAERSDGRLTCPVKSSSDRNTGI